MTMRRRKVLSGTEAHGLHEKYRAHLLAVGRAFAVRIAMEHGTVHVGQVRAAMIARGDLSYSDMPDEAEWRFFGSLLKGGKTWENTGTRAPRHDVMRNTHAGGEGVVIWRLRAGADVTEFAEMPPVEERPAPLPTVASNTDDVLHAERNMLLDFVGTVREYERARVNGTGVAVAWDAVDDALRRMGHPKPTQNVWPEGDDE